MGSNNVLTLNGKTSYKQTVLYKGEFRIVGIIEDTGIPMGYYILDEKTYRVQQYSKAHTLFLLQKFTFSNAICENNEIKCTEHNINRLPKYTRNGIYTSDKNLGKPIIILGKIILGTNVWGYKILDCITFKSLDLDYDKFLTFMDSKPYIVNGKYIPQTMNNHKLDYLSAISGTFTEIQLNTIKEKVSKSRTLEPITDTLENKSDISESTDVQNTNSLKENKEITKVNKNNNKRHLQNLINKCIKRANRPCKECTQTLQQGNISSTRKNLEILQKEYFKSNKNKIDSLMYTQIDNILTHLIAYLDSNNASTLPILMVDYFKPFDKLTTKAKEIMRLNAELYAIYTYIVDLEYVQLKVLNRFDLLRDYCVKNQIGSKKLKGSYKEYTAPRTQLVQSKYWTKSTSFKSKDAINDLGYTLLEKEDGYRIKGTNRHLRAIKFEDGAPNFKNSATCLGDYLVPYNIIQSVLWLAEHPQLDKIKKKEYLQMIEVKIAVLAIYRPDIAKMVYNYCTNYGNSSENWHFLPNYDFTKKVDYNLAPTCNIFYKSGFNVAVDNQGKKVRLVKCNYATDYKHIIELGAIINLITSDNCTSEIITTCLSRAFIIPRSASNPRQWRLESVTIKEQNSEKEIKELPSDIIS